MKKLRLALLGCGGRSYLVLNNAHRPDEGIELCAVSDVSRENIDTFCAKFKEKYQTEVKSYDDYLEMVDTEKPDGVFIITPDFAHGKNACDLLARGVNVYLEKPLAISIDECDNILRCAKDHNTGLMLGHNMRYMIFTRKIKEIIDSGMIGEVRAIWCRHFVNYGGDAYFTRWMSDRDKVNSLLLQKGAHDIDIIHWLAGSHTVRTVAMGNLTVFDKVPRRPEGTAYKPAVPGIAIWPPSTFVNMNPKIDVNDHNMVLLQLANGVQASYEQCFYTPDACRNYTIIGTAGRIENYGDFTTDSTVEVWNQRHIERVFNMKGDFSYDTTAQLGMSHGGADRKIVDDFCAYLRGEKMPDVSPQDSRAATVTGCCAAISARSNSMPVDVPELPEDLKNWQFVPKR